MTTIILALLLLPATGGLLDNGAAETTGNPSAALARTETRDAAEEATAAPKAALFVSENDPQDADAPAAAVVKPAIPDAPQPVTTASLFPHVDARSNVWDMTGYPSGLFIVAVTPAKPAEPHRFFDRENMIGFSIHAAVRAVDATQTCVAISHGAHETWLPIKGCAGIAAYSLSMVPAQIGTSYLLHRRGYHKLERLSPYMWAAPSVAGIGVSMRAW